MNQLEQVAEEYKSIRSIREYKSIRNPRAMNQLEQVAEDGGDTFLRNVG
jgi:hypothetical protein